MQKLKKSIVAWSGAASLLSFGGLYYTIPYDSFLDLALSLAFGVTLAAVIRYSVDAWRAFRTGRGGAEFLIVAIFMVALMLFLQRSWVIILRVYERPDWLVMSPISIFLPWMTAWAISLALVAPDIDGDATGSKGGLWRSIALFIGGALVGFILATSFKMSDKVDMPRLIDWPTLAHRPGCTAREPIVVSSTGVYHVSGSPYRRQVIARWCFATEQEAKEAGFRPPRR